MPGDQRYSDSEAESILKLAASKGSFNGSMTREQLIAAAGELGISAEAVEEAEREYRARAEDEETRKAYDKHVKSDFWGHAVTYLVVNTGLVAYNWNSSGRITWAIWPLIGWGIAIALHAWETYAKGSDDYQKGLVRYRRRRERRGRTTVDESETVRNALDDIALGLDPAEQKLEAIKELRNRTGIDLKHARDAVEEYNDLNA